MNAELILSNREKISHHQQIGGIETSVLDNGPARGSRIVWFQTGALRLKILPDHGMDIADAFYREHSLTWHSHNGLTKAQSSTGRNQQWLEQFSGGLLNTCGLSNIGYHEAPNHEQQPLNGSIHFQSAEILEIKQPDLANGNLEMSLTGQIKESLPFGHRLELTRTYLANLGESTFQIIDSIFNPGHKPVPFMMLYHFNFGWPFIDAGIELKWNGKVTSRGIYPDDDIFLSDAHRYCQIKTTTSDPHGEACGYIEPIPDLEGICRVSIINKHINSSLTLSFYKKELPWLINWQRWVKGEYVVGLEPSTHKPLGQHSARNDGTLLYIQPGEIKKHRLNISLHDM